MCRGRVLISLFLSMVYCRGLGCRRTIDNTLWLCMCGTAHCVYLKMDAKDDDDDKEEVG